MIIIEKIKIINILMVLSANLLKYGKNNKWIDNW